MFDFYVEEISKLLEKSPKTYTKEDLMELSRYDVYVYAVLQMHERGLLGWEQALIYCIMLLSKTCALSMERLFKVASEPKYNIIYKEKKNV